MAYTHCIAEIRKASGVALSEAEAEALIQNLFERQEAIMRRSAGTADPREALRLASRELGEEEAAAAAIAMRNARLNLASRMARRTRIMAAPDPVLGIQAEIHGINTPLRGARFSAEAEGKALSNSYVGAATAELEREGLFGVARSGAIERDTVRELAEISKGKEGTPGLTKSPEALKIAQVLGRYQALARKNMNDAGAWIGDYAGYVAHTQHDPDKIRQAGYPAWREAIGAALDRERTFEGVKDPEKFLHGVYGALTTGVHLTVDGGMGFKDPAFVGPGSLAKRASQERVLHFKDADSWLDYQKRFGEPDALKAIMNGLDRSAKDTALMRRFGTNPRAEFAGDQRWIAEQLRDSKPDQVRRLGEASVDLQNRFDFLDGTANRPANRLGARVASYARLVESLSKLGGVAFTHLSTGMTKAAELRYHGVNLFEAYGDFAASFFRGRGAGETRDIMDRMGAGIEGMQRDLLSRFSPDDSLPGTASKAANLFFKLNGLTYLMNAQKAGAQFVLSRHLGSLLDRPWEDLPAESRRALHVYGLGAAHWEALRSAPEHPEIDGRPFLVPDAAQRADGKALAGIVRPGGALGALGDAKGQAAIGALREELAMKLHAYFHDSADRAIVTPGIPEKALLLQGTRPGTVAGEALRFIAQFKQWPVAAVRQQLGREIYGGQSKQAAVAGIVHMALGSAVLGYLAMSLKDLFKGKTPRDPREPATWASAMMQGGGAGIFGDYLFGDYNRFGQSFGDTMLGPVLGAGVGSVVDMWNDAKGGNKKGFDAWWRRLAADGVRLGSDNAPFVNLFYTRAALNYLFLYQVQEALNPGFLRRFEKRVQEQNHQSFFLRPTPAFGGRR